MLSFFFYKAVCGVPHSPSALTTAIDQACVAPNAENHFSGHMNLSVQMGDEADAEVVFRSLPRPDSGDRRVFFSCYETCNEICADVLRLYSGVNLGTLVSVH